MCLRLSSSIGAPPPHSFHLVGVDEYSSRVPDARFSGSDVARDGSFKICRHWPVSKAADTCSDARSVQPMALLRIMPDLPVNGV